MSRFTGLTGKNKRAIFNEAVAEFLLSAKDEQINELVARFKETPLPKLGRPEKRAIFIKTRSTPYVPVDEEF